MRPFASIRTVRIVGSEPDEIARAPAAATTVRPELHHLESPVSTAGCKADIAPSSSAGVGRTPPAPAPPEQPEESAHGAILAETSSGEILAARLERWPSWPYGRVEVADASGAALRTALPSATIRRMSTPVPIAAPRRTLLA